MIGSSRSSIPIGKPKRSMIIGTKILAHPGQCCRPTTVSYSAAVRTGLCTSSTGNISARKIGDMSVLKSPPIYVTYNGVGLPTTAPHIDFPLGSPAFNPSKTHHLHGSPVYWNGPNGPTIFTWGENESLRSWRLNPQTGQLSFIGKGG